ncbi:MAG TPA: GNAT family N-acetyltransferase [Pyrinomonadaceae bacterium]|nr:GNAT family N-acetyltransferase [Pyrinomonadaceae bacterium]
MDEVVIRECTTIDELDRCVWLQREVFGLPDIEISPRRHLIVSRRAGGWTLGAFQGKELVGFVHHLVAVRGADEIIGYSHMMAVAKDFQNKGVGARLKWAQRDRALAEGRRFIKWTWDPMQSRNAHFNINRLGVVVENYADNFYGTDYLTDPLQQSDKAPGLQSDRLFASWNLDSPRVIALATGRTPEISSAPAQAIAIPSDWTSLVRNDVVKARKEQERVRTAFKEAFAAGLACAGFDRGENNPRYLLYDRDEI